jgi:hypothetical protein
MFVGGGGVLLWGMEKKQAVNNLRFVSQVVSYEREGCIFVSALVFL